MNVLVSSAGRRVALIQCFRTALAGLGTTGKIIAADASSDAPALHFADESCLVPRCLDERFIPSLYKICKEYEIDAIVPTIDTELPVLAAHRAELEKSGAVLWLSSRETVEITSDKRLSNRWLRSHGFPTVAQYHPHDALSELRESDGPFIVKPPLGSASVGVRRINTLFELESFSNREVVVESIAPGVEYTIHVWAGSDGKALCAVPCRRLEVRAGEVSKGRTEKHKGLMRLAQDIVEALPGCKGALNVQIFLDKSGEMNVIEINPRFGGGYPLVDRAGATFARWIVDREGGLNKEYFDDWTDGLTMLRYDSAVFVSS